MGRVIRAWRTHPYHGRRPIPQDHVASWFGITQAQLSRIENGPPLAHLDRLTQWARVLHIPADRLWFTLPATANQSAEEKDRMERRNLIAAAGATLATGLLGNSKPGEALSDDLDAVKWLAWHLWQHRWEELHQSQIPNAVRCRLDRHPHVVRTPNNTYRFTDPALANVLIAHRVFDDITQGSGHLLATVQTSHTTALTISALTADNDSVRQGLAAWMQRGPTAILRVNAAGILAKAGLPALGDAAISAIRADHEVRHLYLTAVASRVLETPWDEAARIAAVADGRRDRPSTRSDLGRELWAAKRLTGELTNPRDAAARWCSAVLLATLSNIEHDTTRMALLNAVPHEACRENLRAYAAVLAQANPITI